jgi:hypothetical protein
MTEEKQLRATLKLSRREQEIVEEIAESLTSLESLREKDGRREITHEVVKHRFGSYDPSRERMVPIPNWGKVLSLRACPNCNPLAENMGRLMPKGKDLECRACRLKLTQQQFARAKESAEAEKKWVQNEEKLEAKIEKYGIKDERLERLYDMAEQRLDAEARKKGAAETPKEAEKP